MFLSASLQHTRVWATSLSGHLICGVVWCGVVWCGVVWCGVVWCGGTVHCDVWGDYFVLCSVLWLCDERCMADH